MNIKDKFFKYIGQKDKIEPQLYQRSYKLILLKYLVELMDEEGRVRVTDIGEYFKNFYLYRKEQGLIHEVDADPSIKNIESSSLNRVILHIKDKPFKAIKDQGYMSIEMIQGEEYFCFNKDLMEQLTPEDIHTLQDIIESKITLYFEGIDMKQGEKQEQAVNQKDELQRIEQYLSAKGFTYDKDMIKNFYLSLKSKPFVILAGTSGTGKSRLVKLFAESIGATTENGRFTLIPVRPDWSDSSDLLGFRDLQNVFHAGLLTPILYEAIDHSEHPYFVCLDEMNLARVEYYLSDILSIIETREIKNDKIMTDYLFHDDAFGTDEDARDKYSQLYIPENVFFIGTVNMDETTFPFSKKVLDRANTIEFSDVDLAFDFTDREYVDVQPRTLHNHFLKSEFLILKDCKEHGQVVQDTIAKLQRINDTLKQANLQFGYRVRDEICFYMVYNQKFDLLSFNQAMDFEILQKILPRIQGSSARIKEVLKSLFEICTASRTSYQNESSASVYEKMDTYCKNNIKNIPFPKSAIKIAFMMRRWEEDGFTSYWL